ncbi:MAG TPA: TolC family protein, partial [Novosphingobium sp.]|nr:TolC family protein [Novosphingobium sp.]
LLLDQPAAAPATPPAPWWQQAGDGPLAAVVGHALAANPALRCRAAGLAASQRHASQSLGARLARAFGARRLDTPRTPPPADEEAYATARMATALSVGLAYVDLRLAQERLALREAAIAPLKDNREIARFRREAGLVSAVDADLAGTMVDLNEDALAGARAARDAALARLAALAGMSSADLAAAMGPVGPSSHVPGWQAAPAPRPFTPAPDARADIAALALRLGAGLAAAHVAPADIAAARAPAAHGKPSARQRQAAAALAQLRQAEGAATAELQAADAALLGARQRAAVLAGRLPGTARALADVRLGYRSGTETFATLYVAEGAALALAEAEAEARAGAARAALGWWQAQALGWQSPAPLATAEGAACD